MTQGGLQLLKILNPRNNTKTPKQKNGGGREKERRWDKEKEETILTSAYPTHLSVLCRYLDLERWLKTTQTTSIFRPSDTRVSKVSCSTTTAQC